MKLTLQPFMKLPLKLFIKLPLKLLLMSVWWPGALLADQNDARLDALFQQLQQAENATQALPLEARIWDIWVEHDNAQLQQLMLKGMAQMGADDLRGALATYTQLIESAPEYAEAWNKRATIYYLLGDYKASEADIDATLKLEPYHFGALSGLGLVCIAQNEYLRARTAFSAALEVYPAMDGVKANLQALEQMLRNSAI